jgi:hypothetical protein
MMQSEAVPENPQVPEMHEPVVTSESQEAHFSREGGPTALGNMLFTSEPEDLRAASRSLPDTSRSNSLPPPCQYFTMVHGQSPHFLYLF